MTLIVFVVDTSFSMAVKNYRGCSQLDTAKSFISEFIKMRGRDNANKMYDKFMVITSEEYPKCVKEIKQLNREGALNDQLKHIRPVGKQSFLDTLNNAFQYINLLRTSTGIENHAYGRCPYFIEPVVFIALSDGIAADEIGPNVKLESRTPSDHVKEIYRWDQRLFSVVLRLSFEPVSWVPGSRVDPDNANIEKVCNLVAGNSFRIASHREITPCIEAILQSIVFHGVAVKFMCPTIQNLRVNGEADTPETKLKRRLEQRPLTRIFVRHQPGSKITGNWPIPETFWYRRVDNLPTRNANPVIHFGQEAVTTQLHTDFAFEKYELEPSPLVDYMLERFKGSSDERQCLQIFVHNSGRTEGFGKPFGFLKVMTNGAGVNVFLMPYNYPVLFQLIQDLKNDIAMKDRSDWKRRMDSYLDGVPPYYMSNLKKALAKYRISGCQLLEEGQRQTYSTNILSYINGLLAQGKEERANVQNRIDAHANSTSMVPSQTVHLDVTEPIHMNKNWRANFEPPKKEKRIENRRDPRNSKPQEVQEELFKDPEALIDVKEPKRVKFDIHIAENRIKPPFIESTYRNPLLLKKTDLISQVPRMMANLNLLARESKVPLLEGGRPGVQLKLHHAENLHNLPIQQMGNYEEYIKAQNEIGMGPLRELEPKAVRSHAFGNPFKTDKKSMAIDEVGEEKAVENNSALNREVRNSSKRGRPPRRKAGPLTANSLCAWRERRRTISERSSVVSYLSYTSDLEIDDLSEVDHQNGNGAEKDLADAVDDWGLEEEAVDGTDDAPKNKKLKMDPSVNLTAEELKAKKLLVVQIVRKSNNDEASLREIKAVSSGLSASDCLELVQLGQRDSMRFKRHSLVKRLETEVTRLQMLVRKQRGSL